MATRPVNIGIIGAGLIGRSHMQQYQKLADVKMVAVCDINEEAAKKAATDFGIGQTFTDFRKVLALPDIEAVDVCLHNNLHAPVSIAAMEAGKHVYCEKPLAGSYADATSMVEAAKRTGKHLAMQLGTIFSDSTLSAKRLIDEGHLGHVYYAKSFGYRRRGRPFVDGYATPAFVQKKVAAGGALYDMGVYHIGQMLYLLGNPKVLTVSGATHQEVDMYEHRRKESNYDVEEFATGFVRLAGGISFYIEEAWAVNLGGGESSKIAGSKGGVTLDPFTFHSTVGDLDMNATVAGGGRGRWKMVWPEKWEPFDGNQQHWVAVLRDQVPPLPSAEVGANMMLIAEGIFLSQKLGREVSAEEVVKASKSTALKL
jgi:predicted dehydrogenase